MAVITPGTGGTIKSGTAEGQAQEILSFIAIKQQSLSTNPGEVDNVSASHDIQALIFTGTYRFSVTQSIDGAGNLSLSVNPYLVGTAFQEGTGGTFKGNSPEKYCLEVLMFLQATEQNPAKNTQNRNFIRGTFDSDTGIYTGSFSIPVSVGLDSQSGAVEYTAQPYLL